MAPISFQKLIDKTISYINGPATNRPKLGTVTELTFSGSEIATLNVEAMDGSNTHRGPAIIEIEGSALVYASSWNADTGDCVVPSWGNGFEGAPAADGGAAFGTKAVINPIWPRHFVGLHVIDAINSMYPRLYGVKVTELTSDTVAERYEVPADCEGILSLKIEWYGSTAPRREIKRRELQTINTDGNRYLSIAPVGVSGRPIYLTYKTKPILPEDTQDIIWDWSDSLLPDTASDIPAIKAAMTLIESPELAKMQVYSVEVSERSKFVQAGMGNAASRRLQELYDKRMAEEQDALSMTSPMRSSMRYN